MHEALNLVAFIDIEVHSRNGAILDTALWFNNGKTYHGSSIPQFEECLREAQFICGHNILKHDLVYLKKYITASALENKRFIDTLLLSPLLFPTKPYHALLKDDKLQTEDLNNPLNDAQKARDLFFDEINAFHKLSPERQTIFYGLLNKTPEFSGFFNYIGFHSESFSLIELIKTHYADALCTEVDLLSFITNRPIELAYALAIIGAFKDNLDSHSITPPWVLKSYPYVEQLLIQLRNKTCLNACAYCRRSFDIHRALKHYFGHDNYRSYHGEALQEKAVQAAVNQESMVVVFPTGGGKSITFQVPALMSGENARGLTVVISPLQSLMKDQVDNLERLGITEAVTINGLLDPIERAKSFQRVEEGNATLLYISPESLRSKSIERLLLGRKIVRFVIDEAHCFSSWGQDFRVDYLYIGDFIQQIQIKKQLDEPIPVSCFTATAKQKVIDDICDYFREKLNLNLKVFSTKTARTNLHYTVFEKGNDEEKYQALRHLIESKVCPTIVYVSRTKRAYYLSDRLTKDGFQAKPYHGKMESKEKNANQQAFIEGDIPIMVATSAFGMGVDKKDVGMVIHFDISDSLENYVQEAGRAGRDEHIQADCYVLFNEEDLSKHFILLNQTKISIKEIQQVWKAIRELTRFRNSVSNSALEIARRAGWDDSVMEIETRVTTAIAALEEAGYVKRGQNMPRLFANSILSKNLQEAIEKISASQRFNETQKMNAIRIIKKLISSKSRIRNEDEQAESRVDYISDHLGIVKEEVIQLIQLLREEQVLADAKDLSAFIKRSEHKNRSLQLLQSFLELESFLYKKISEEEQVFHLKELNEEAEVMGYAQVNPNKIKTLINFWAIKQMVKRQFNAQSKHHVSIASLHSKAALQSAWEKRRDLAHFIVDYLYTKRNQEKDKEEQTSDEIRIEFSVQELLQAFRDQNSLFTYPVSSDDIEDTLYYLAKIESIQIEGGFMVVYNRITLERIETDNKRLYKVDDYKKLNQFYENKIQQIHIVGEYAKRMISDYQDALQFVEDYFQLNYASFLNKYFKGNRQKEIKRNITPRKFQQLFGELSPTQLKIINDNSSKHIVVAAGPGSGKTRVLVHKLASLLLMEDVKHEQLLMITFSRASATEFKKRLIQLIGNAAQYIEIKTFHAYCFDLLGKVGSLDKSDHIIGLAVEKIKNKEVESNRITKTVLVIDEAQDMNADEFALVETLMEHNEEMRVIAVGDDDQNIFTFRGSDSRYMEKLISEYGAIQHELVENYRSKSNLVALSNSFIQGVKHRLKSTPVMSMDTTNGEIRLMVYNTINPIQYLARDVLNYNHSGTVCVLTRTNEEALQVVAYLRQHNMPVKLIQSNEGFSLYQWVELRYFITALNLQSDTYLIDEEAWVQAKRVLKQVYQTSTVFEWVVQLVKDFEAIHPNKKYTSDFMVFIRESKLEDFMSVRGETVIVSTIHKAKGREFDHVFLLPGLMDVMNDETRRLMYVALTRAKHKLSIHAHATFINTLLANESTLTNITEPLAPLNTLILPVNHKGIWLDYSRNCQDAIHQLQSGDALTIKETTGFNQYGQAVFRFSKSFSTELSNYLNQGFSIKKVTVRFIVYWTDEKFNREIKVVLPEVWLGKSNKG